MEREISINSSPITRRQILDSSKLKDFADDNLKFEENGRKLFKPVENTVGKGASKGFIVWEWPKEDRKFENGQLFLPTVK